jgi:hypothetical protein
VAAVASTSLGCAIQILCGNVTSVVASTQCADSSTERKFPSDKVYRRDDRGIVGIESLSASGLAFFVIHAVLPPRLPRAADRLEPHGEEPPPIAAPESLVSMSHMGGAVGDLGKCHAPQSALLR